MLKIRFEQENDIKQIDELLHKAATSATFAQNKQYLCVTILRRIKALRLALVVERNEKIIGYIAAIPVTINARPCSWVALYPMAIDPDVQQQGIGAKLLDAALEYLETQNIDGCISIGAPDFYAAQGFVRSPLITIDAVPNSQFLVYQLKKAIPIGHVKLHTAFTSLIK